MNEMCRACEDEPQLPDSEYGARCEAAISEGMARWSGGRYPAPEDSPHYRQSMKDAGRGSLLR